MTSTSERIESVDDRSLGELGRALDTDRIEPGMLSESVYRVLRDAILAGRIAERAHLSQNPLADALGVSRTPLRDALQRLAQDGLIQSVGGRGYVVVPVEMTEVEEIYEVRKRLVEWALALVRGRITPADLWAAQRAHQEMTNPAALEPSQYFNLNRAFHRAFLQSCPNRTLLVLIDKLWELPTSQRMFIRYNGDPETVAKMIREHETILATARAGDHDALTRVILAHISDAEVDTTAFIAREGLAGTDEPRTVAAPDEGEPAPTSSDGDGQGR